MAKQEEVELKAPEGKFRVIGVDLFEGSRYLVDDYDDRQKAYDRADEHNKAREGAMSNVYYVYDDQGDYIRGNEAVNQPVCA